MPLTANDLRGVFPALTTSFDKDGNFDAVAMKAHVARMFDAGMTGIVPLGGTGEYTAMSPGERVDVVTACVEAAKGRGPVIAGVLSPGLAEAIEAGKRFAQAGADAIMLVSPFYVLGGQPGICDYYRRFHAEVGLPIVLYEIPERTNVSYAPQTVATLADEGIAIGIKYSNLDMVKFTQVMNAAGDKMAVMAGDDRLLAAQMVLGAPGTILATANLCPKAWVECFRLGQAGDFAAAAALNKKLYPMMEAVFSEPNPTALKCAMSIAGHDAGPVRLPLLGARPDTEDRLKAMIASAPELF
ncbi:MAG: 4-hydroxy-tetrahydrodipicolinate synthase [Tepidamorphaceae bacterium]|nr:4-hydroxy-tetrahydrodipicolinate synthase [Rhodobiaceae bacterium]